MAFGQFPGPIGSPYLHLSDFPFAFSGILSTSSPPYLCSRHPSCKPFWITFLFLCWDTGLRTEHARQALSPLRHSPRPGTNVLSKAAPPLGLLPLQEILLVPTIEFHLTPPLVCWLIVRGCRSSGSSVQTVMGLYFFPASSCDPPVLTNPLIKHR